jgi:hypothetical protein
MEKDLSAVVDDGQDGEEDVAGQPLQQHRARRVRREVHRALQQHKRVKEQYQILTELPLLPVIMFSLLKTCTHCPHYQ